MREVKRSFMSIFNENAHIAGEAPKAFEMNKANLIKQYCDVNGFSKAMVYRHYKKVQDEFLERKVERTTMIAKKPVRTQTKAQKREEKRLKKAAEKAKKEAEKPVVNIPKTRQAILMEKDAEKMRAFVLEVLMNHADIFPTVMQGAKKRAEKLHIEKMIAHHAREIERLQKELLD